ncbi:MAG: hypothetical protein WBY88_01355 [Desulfosarcina sp.]
MRSFTTNDLKQLMAIEKEVCISIYMPAEPSAASMEKQRIGFKNLMQRAQTAAQERSPEDGALFEMIDQGWRLLDGDPRFWQYLSDGLAVFIAPGFFKSYRLPVRFEEMISVADRFSVKPLIPLFMADGWFYILALSQNEVRLFSCTRHHLTEIDLNDVPDGIAETLQYDTKQSQLQFHTGTAGGNGGRSAMFHGHGVGTDDKKDDIRRYFQDVNRGLSSILSDSRIPLVLAGVEYLLPIFRAAASPHLWIMDEAITGNPEELRADELQKNAFSIVRPQLEKKQRLAEARYRELAGKGATAAGVQTVVPAAVYGRVETLFVALDQHCPGIFDRNTNQVTVSTNDDPQAQDLLELAVVQTLSNGGAVFAVDRAEMPEADSEVAALLRY